MLPSPLPLLRDCRRQARHAARRAAACRYVEFCLPPLGVSMFRYVTFDYTLICHELFDTDAARLAAPRCFTRSLRAAVSCRHAAAYVMPLPAVYAFTHGSAMLDGALSFTRARACYDITPVCHGVDKN